MEQKILNKKISDSVNEDKKAKVLFQSIAFRLDDSVYAMDVMFIQEIIFAHKIYRVPNTDSKLLGVLNLRGNILPVYSLKLILGIEDDFKGLDIIQQEEKFIIMLKKDRDVFGVLIDAVYKNISATEDNFKTGKHIERWSKNNIFTGVILETDKEILVIHIENILKYIISLK